MSESKRTVLDVEGMQFAVEEALAAARHLIVEGGVLVGRSHEDCVRGAGVIANLACVAEGLADLAKQDEIAVGDRFLSDTENVWTVKQIVHHDDVGPRYGVTRDATWDQTVYWWAKGAFQGMRRL